MQVGHHQFQGRTSLFFVHFHRDTTAIIRNGATQVIVQGHMDFCAEAGQGLVDRVVHHLVDQVVQAPFPGVADVHGRALADRFKAF